MLFMKMTGVEKMFRLGRWSEDKARPLLVSFKDLGHKETILSNLVKLRAPIEKFRGVGISPDIHPKEREEIKRMVELNRRISQLNLMKWKIIDS